MKIPKLEQLEAILEYKEVILAEKYGLKDTSDIPWDISAKEVRKYIDQNGFPERWVYFSERSSDGIYFIKKGLYWTVLYKERGIINYSKKFIRKNKAINYILDKYFLRRIGIK